MEALRIISAEHSSLWRLVTAVDQVCQEIEAGALQPDIDFFGAVLDYVGSYVNTMHHPKENDYLFKIMQERLPESKGIIAQLMREHEDEPKEAEHLHQILEKYAARPNPVHLKALLNGVQHFCQHIRAHIKTEETTVMPMAKKGLLPEDWAQIDLAFANNEDPLFGVKARTEYTELHKRIVNIAPDPVGLGGMTDITHKMPEKTKATVPNISRPPASQEIVLEIKNLESYYGRIQALRGINLKVRKGELVALVGANGAGKTTLLRAISGVQPVTRGSIAFNGRDITKLRADLRMRQGICQVPEGRQVFGAMSIEDNLLMGAYTQDKRTFSDDIERVYGMFPILKEKRLLPAGTLSGGQQQMLAMGRALMGHPQLLLLDEPSMGLAPLLVEEIFNAVKMLKSEGMTIFLVEQNAYAALSIADVGYVIEIGETTLSGPGQALLENEKVREAYLGM